ncbi:type III-A CRISPR-associated RAMP protein Csm3 [Caminibacter profundus]
MKAKLRLITGLHIGGGDDTMKIGGIDSSVIKREVFVNSDGSICYAPEYDENGNLKDGVRKITEPYIPGSSLKGKVRSLLEYAFGLIREQKRLYENHQDEKKRKKVGKVIDSEFIKDCDDKLLKKKAELIVTLFGESAGTKSNKKLKITRAIFRDTFLTKESRKLYLEEKITLSEEKGENTINRVTVEANPRFIERVPAGVEFDFEVVLRKFEDDKNLPLEETLKLGLMLLQNDALGGGGSRGNGKIEFDIFNNETLHDDIKNLIKEIENKLKD